MKKDELIRAIRESALTDGEYNEVFQVLFETMLGGALLGMGMDMTTGAAAKAVGGRWIPAPMCYLDHKSAPDNHGWRTDQIGDPATHYHWVES